MKSLFKKCYWLLISVLIVCLDQLTKWIVSSSMDLYEEIVVIPDFFSITYIHNEGIAFGLLAKYGWVSKLVVALLTSCLIIFGIIVLLKGIITHPFGVVTISMVIGGGIGNLIDRIRLQYVVDFFSFTFFGRDFAVFNVADIFVTIGVACLFVFILIVFEKNDKKRTETEHE